MKIPSSTHISIATMEAAPAAPAAAHTASPSFAQSTSIGKAAAPEAAKAQGSAVTDPKEEKSQKERELPAVSSRQLMEIQGNPAATAENAAKVQRELSPPENPYPSVQELATVRRAQAMERAARAEIHDSKTDTVDRRV